MLWIESQNTPVIVLLTFAFAYVLAAFVFGAARIVATRRLAADHLKATTPAMLTPLGMIIGLLIAFHAARVWANLDHASAYVAHEASAIRQTELLANALPLDVRTAVHGGIMTYLQFAEGEDWPAMAQSRATLQRDEIGSC